MVVEGKRQFGAAQHNSVTFMSRHIRSPSVHGWNKVDSLASCSRSQLRSLSGSAWRGGICKEGGIFENGPRACDREATSGFQT